MKIDEVIRRYRKEAGLTQEQVASYLGVTAPAVNKWENGNSCPDIALLAPLARILNINVDTLLSFDEEPDPSRLCVLLEEVNELLRTEGTGAGFVRAEELIRRYPACDTLTLCLAQILDMQLTMDQQSGAEDDTEIRDARTRKILTWYELVAAGRNANLADTAKSSLVSYYRKNGAYEKAQKLLDEIPERFVDKRQMQAGLYSDWGKEADACRLYELIVFQNACEISSALLVLLEKKQKAGQLEEAEKIGAIIRQFAELLELGGYNQNAAEYFLAWKTKDRDRLFHALCGFADYLEEMEKNPNPKKLLYPHLTGKQPESAEAAKRSVQRLREMVLHGLRYDEELEFFRKDARYQSLVERLGGR